MTIRYAINASSTKLSKNSNDFELKEGWYKGRMVYAPSVIRIVNGIKNEPQKTFDDKDSAQDCIKDLPKNIIRDASITAYSYEVFEVELHHTGGVKEVRSC